jgi:uncharacterized membrane protein HdeD (DUF308 family)
MKALYIICGILILIQGIQVIAGTRVMSPDTYGSWIVSYGVFAILVGLTGGKK